MLSKLIKYEFKSTAKWFFPLYAFTVVLAQLTKMLISSSIFEEGMLNIIPTAITSLYVISIVATFIITFFLIVYRFYKSMVTNEGYLTHTLPVTTTKLILSKLISATLWAILASIIALISILILYFDVTEFQELKHFFSSSNLQLIAEELSSNGFSFILTIIEAIVLVLITICYYILKIYAAIAIGQLFNTQKLLASFAFYFVLGFITQVISIFIMLVPMFSDWISSDGSIDFFHTLLPTGIISTFLLCVIHFAITNYIFSKKLNLE
ncbi:hypothetical protein [Velocimicrobium porci]|uniref:Uncharacterized protein n=1 Tax=Velocimicrobium porci TaxID=2606634 RepID=A0A6L5Y188_9FIRM|nr:hypothetical protein [Velocimicrobium porci]MSS64694.1 hypothetical protein [Velocimicrobium porci]